jgi:hypothetical protein
MFSDFHTVFVNNSAGTRIWLAIHLIGNAIAIGIERTTILIDFPSLRRIGWLGSSFAYAE